GIGVRTGYTHLFIGRPPGKGVTQFAAKGCRSRAGVTNFGDCAGAAGCGRRAKEGTLNSYRLPGRLDRYRRPGLGKNEPRSAAGRLAGPGGVGYGLGVVDVIHSKLSR